MIVQARYGPLGILVRKFIQTDNAHRNAVRTGQINAPGVEDAGGFAIQQQCLQHSGRILFTATAAFLDLDFAQIQLFQQTQNEMGQKPSIPSILRWFAGVGEDWPKLVLGKDEHPWLSLILMI